MLLPRLQYYSMDPYHTLPTMSKSLPSSAVPAILSYLARDELYTREKPYSVEFEISQEHSEPSTNYKLCDVSVKVLPVPTDSHFHLNTHGFCIMQQPINLDARQALSGDLSWKEPYMSELKRIMFQSFPEYKLIEPIECVVRVLNRAVDTSVLTRSMSRYAKEMIASRATRSLL